MNGIFAAIIFLSVAFAAWSGTPAEVGKAALDSAKSSVELAIGLVGYMALFLGLMKIVEEAGGLKLMARIIRPIVVRLFPEIPPDHPAVGAMIMNMSANALGLGNAATPFGIKAMKELDSLNPSKGTATNAMVLFLALNTSGLALLPSGIIGLRAHFDSADPAAIFTTTLMATAISTITGLTAAKLLCRLPVFAQTAEQDLADAERRAQDRPRTDLLEFLPLIGLTLAFGGLVYATFHYGEAVSSWIIPCLISGMVGVGVARKVPVYEVFVAGAKEGFSLAITIIPYLVAILSAVGMFRASGGLDLIIKPLAVITGPLGLPAEALPLALLRPLSGSGAFGLTAELIQTHGPDSYTGQLVSTMNGSTETTFYVLAVYFGSVGITRLRHGVFAGLAADFMGVVGSVIAVQLLLG